MHLSDTYIIIITYHIYTKNTEYAQKSYKSIMYSFISTQKSITAE